MARIEVHFECQQTTSKRVKSLMSDQRSETSELDCVVDRMEVSERSEEEKRRRGEEEEEKRREEKMEGDEKINK